MKPNKEHILSQILIQLRAGTTYTATKAAVICGDLRLSDRTFDTYWKTAQQRYSEEQQQQQQQLRDQSDAAALAAQEAGILTKEAAMLILSNTAKGEADGKLKPTFGERTQAVKVLAELQGWEAPKKLDLTNPGTMTMKIVRAKEVDDD